MQIHVIGKLSWGKNNVITNGNINDKKINEYNMKNTWTRWVFTSQMREITVTTNHLPKWKSCTSNSKRRTQNYFPNIFKTAIKNKLYTCISKLIWNR